MDEDFDESNPFASGNLDPTDIVDPTMLDHPAIAAAAQSAAAFDELTGKLQDTLQLGPAVQQVIDMLMPKDDPLFRPDFDLVSYINHQFPTEQSLANVDDVIVRVSQQIQSIDVEIADLLHTQSSASKDGHAALLEAKESIRELFTRIRDIKEKTDLSESMVKEITRDIKQLDHAKRNLTSSITTLNHLHMLLAGVENLTSHAKQRQYGDIANLLPGIMNVLEHFQNYIHIPQVKELADQVQGIRRDLSQQVLSEFRDSVSGGKPFAPTRQMVDACRVVSVLDPSVKQSLIAWFVKMQLSEYLVLFEDTQDTAWLDKIEQRYGWFIKQLTEMETKYDNMFPAEWDMPQRLSLEFCQHTRKDLERLMQKRVHEIDVKLLLYAIQRTNQFETKLQRRFPLKHQETVGAEAASESAEETKNVFHGIISQCFEAHLGIYTAAQDKNLNDLLEQFNDRFRHEGPPKAVTESSAIPLKSSPDLFQFYKKCIVNCQQISVSQKPMVELAKVFKKYLREYARRCLTNFLPRINAASAANTPGLIQSLLKEGDVPKLTAEEIYQVCCILVTAEYCAETTQQLQEKLKEKVGPSLHDQVEMNAEQDVFHQVINTCVHVLVQDLESSCDPALQAMVKKQWSAVEAVGDESSYVLAIKGHLRQLLPRLRDYLSQARKYFIQFCMKFASTFIPKFINALYKCKPITVSGAEQLLLDTHSLKTELLNLPSVDSSAQRKPPASFTKLVVKGMTKAEMILKVVMSDDKAPDAFLENYLRLLPESDIHDFQKVMDMRAVRRADQSQLLELYRQKTAASGHLPFLAASAVPQDVHPPGGGGGSATGQLKQATNFMPASIAAPLMSLTGDLSADSRIKRLEKLIMKK